MALIISSKYNGTLKLTSKNNPLTITSTGRVTATAQYADAIDGGSGVNWLITNYGTVSSSNGFGIYLLGSGTINNYYKISGYEGVRLAAGGSLTNFIGGVITATGIYYTNGI